MRDPERLRYRRTVAAMTLDDWWRDYTAALDGMCALLRLTGKHAALSPAELRELATDAVERVLSPEIGPNCDRPRE